MLEFKKGEVQYVSATVRAETPGEIAVINSASYKLTGYEDKMIIQEGNCEIIGDILRILLHCIKEGFYTLTITAHIGKETIIRDEIISVTK